MDHLIGDNGENTFGFTAEFTVTDSDGSTVDESFGVTVVDDIPTAVDDTTTTGEDTQVTYNVITNGDGTSDSSGADTPATADFRDAVFGIGHD